MDQLATRLADAKLGAAIEDACKHLPNSCIIDIQLMRDSATVTLDIDGVVKEFPSNHESLGETIRDAVDFATGILRPGLTQPSPDSGRQAHRLQAELS